MKRFDAVATSRVLSWGPLVHAIERTLADAAQGHVQAPERWVLPIAPNTSWFMMPAWLTGGAGDLAAVKLITYAADNPGRGLPAILGDVLVLRASTGEPLALIDGPALTARRTAAVTLHAARRLAPQPMGPLLVIGTGVQALAHVAALTEALGVDEVWVRGRTPASGLAFAQALHQRGLSAEVVTNLAATLQRCPLVVTATPAQAVCLEGTVRDDAFVAAIGAFTPQMIELDPALTRDIAARGQVVIDSAAARHEGGDLLAAGIDLAACETLLDQPARQDRGTTALEQHRPAGIDLAACETLLDQPARQDRGPVLFKSCGSALWDLAAARCVVEALQGSAF